MATHESTDSSSLVPSASKDLTLRSSVLVRRALDDIARIAPSLEEIHRVLSAGVGVDLDAYGAAAKAIIDLTPSLHIQDDRVGTLVFQLVYALQRFFPSEGEAVLTRSCRGERYFPPNEELRDLLVRALQSLVGPFSDPIDAVIAAFTRGGRATRIEAAGWLHSSDIPNAASLLQDALAHTDDEFFALVLRYALVSHDKEDFDTVVNALVDYMANCSSDVEREWCGQLLFELGWPFSADTLGRLVCTLGAGHDDDARRWALVSLIEAFHGGADDPQDEETGFKRLKDCSDDVLEGLTRIAWHEFLRENHLHEPYVSLHVGARGRLLSTLTHLAQQKQVRWEVHLTSGSPWPKPDRYRDLCWTLQGLLEHALARQQIEVYRQAIRTAPDDPSPHRSLAEALETAGFADDAILQYSEVVRLKPLDYLPHERLASALRHAGHLEQAIQEYTRAVRLAPGATSFFVRKQLVRALTGAERFHEAILEARQLLNLAERITLRGATGPEPSKFHLDQAHNTLGDVLRAKGELDEAIRHYSESIRLMPDRPLGHYHVAQCLQKLGRFADALPHFQAALDLGYDFAYSGVAECKRQLGMT